MIIDPFGGPGGWAEGLRQLGHTEVGVEWDDAACRTRRAAGHPVIRADVRTFPIGHLTGIDGLTMSPPCQTFSSAGKGGGRSELDRLSTAIDRGDWAARYDGHEVLEVGRWAETIRPRWIACEQVPPVLPLWQAYAARWRALHGWSCWAGLLCAADYGVPQTRTRAFLLARTDGRPVHPPVATHCKGGAVTLLGELAPWVSMADALGWTGELHHWRGAGMTERHGDRPGRPTDEPAFTIEGGAQRRMVIHRDPDQPAPTLCGHRQPRWLYPDGLRAGAQDNATVRTVDEPAPTVLGSWDNGDTRWVVRTGQNSRQAGGTTEMYERPIDEAAATLTGQARSWVFGQPATTIAGDPRITARCHHEHGTQGADANTTDQVRAGDYQGTEPVKLTLTEALILQSFPPDYPVQGTKSKQFEQVGNAVPPLLAAHVIAALTGQALEAAA